MADEISTWLGVTIGADLDEESIDKVEKQFKLKVSKIIKEGYTKLPVTAEFKIDKRKKYTKQQLTSIDNYNEALSGLISTWEKQSEKGFRSSAKYVEELVEKFQGFKTAKASLNRRGLSEGIPKQNEDLKNAVDVALKPYFDGMKRIETRRRQLDKAEQVRIKNARKAANNYNRQVYKSKGLSKDLEALGYGRGSAVDEGRTSSEAMLLSARRGGYNSNLEQYMANSRKSFYETFGNEIKARTLSKEATEKAVKDAYSTKYEGLIREETRKKNGQIDIKYKKGTKTRPEKKPLTDKERAAGLSDATLTKIGKVLTALAVHKPEVTTEDLAKYLEARKKYDDKSGKGVLNTILGVSGKAMGKYYGLMPYFDIGFGDNDYRKKEYKEDKDYAIKHDKEIRNRIIAIFEGIKKQVSPEEMSKAEELRQRRVAVELSKSRTNKFDKGVAPEDEKHKYGKGVSILSKEVNDLVESGKLQEIINSVFTEKVAEDTDAIVKTAKEKAGRKVSKKTLETPPKKGAIKTTTPITSTEVPIAGFGDGKCPCEEILNGILNETYAIHQYIQAVLAYLYKTPVIVKQKEQKKTTEESTATAKPSAEEIRAEKFNDALNRKGIPMKGSQSEIISSSKFFGKLGNVLRDVLKRTLPESEADRIMKMNKEQQEEYRAQRIKDFGLNREGRPGSTGMKASAKYIKKLFHRGLGIGENEDLLQNIKLTPGFTGETAIDTTKIFNNLNKALSKSMFNAQTGGGFARNVVGAMTGFVGMPSLEKSRALADGLNQVMANVRNSISGLINDVKDKEMALLGLQKSGQAVFKEDGTLDEAKSSAESIKLFSDLEEQKGLLGTSLADVRALDKVVASCRGNVNQIVKELGFTSPMLMENNTIIQNLNAGLDRTGKALKFHTRLGEILNYTFQLMGRHIGQMLKGWIMQLNPLTQIKKLFSDFMGYNTKWQRTMNVIKYNIRALVRPFMEWIAQQLVNIIGFLDVIAMKIQEAFGRTPVSVFDQAAADSEKIKEELEAAANVSAGFDELHDIGSDNSGANDLLGDIYKPQLSPEWKKLAEDIGNLFAGIIKGDLGFGDVIKKIWEIFLEFLGIVGKYIGEWFVNTIWPLIKDNWLSILGWMFAAFLAWNLLKVGGSLLANAILGGLKGVIGKLLGTGGAVGAEVATSGSLLGKLFASNFAKTLGGLAMTAAGTIGAVSLAGVTGKNWQDMSDGMKVVSVAGTGLLSVISGLGAVMLGASGPAGWAVAGVTALGALTYGMLQTQNGIKSVKEETEHLTEAQNIAKVANDNYLISLDNLARTTANLEQIESETGLSGKALADQIKKGTLTVDDMTTAQLRCYNAYVQNEEMIKQNKKAIEEKTAANKQAEIQSLRTEIANAKESGSYDQLKQHIIEAYKNGSLSAKECQDITERALAEMSESSQKTFLQDIPTDITNGLDPHHYESGWQKFARSFLGVFDNLGKSIEKWWKGLWGITEFTDGGGNGFGGGGGGSRSVSVPKMATGTNYVPNDGLFYLHQGEAVIPKKYNQPYNQGMSNEERAYMQQMMATMKSLDGTMKQGIVVNGQFVQRGSDLVAVVNKTKSQTGSDLLSNVSYAR